MSEQIRLYSKRILQPYVGVVQVADLGWARALSLDGLNWAVRYSQNENKHTRHARFSHDPRVNLTMIVNIEGDQADTRVIRQAQDPIQLQRDSQRIFDTLADAQIPFEAADHYEYWLLDGDDETPLALLHSCLSEQDMRLPVPPSEWLSIPAAQLSVPDPEPKPEDPFVSQAPINSRLQQCIEQCAGSRPKAAWFNRKQSSSVSFPPCLIRDEWDDPEHQRLSELYLNRLAPRLLMIEGLSRAVRQRLEKAASEHALDVDKFYPLYPEVVDNTFLNAARVEARLRRAL